MIAALLLWMAAHRALVETAAVILALLLIVFLWNRHEQNQGATACIQSNESKALADQRKDLRQREADTRSITDAVRSYAITTLPPVVIHDGSVCIRTAAARMPTSAAAAAGSDATADRRATNSSADIESTGRDIAAPLVTIGRDSDAKLTLLQRYVRDVCRPELAN